MACNFPQVFKLFVSSFPPHIIFNMEHPERLKFWGEALSLQPSNLVIHYMKAEKCNQVIVFKSTHL